MRFAYRRSFIALTAVLALGAVLTTVADRRHTILKARELLDSASIILLDHAERSIEDGDKLILGLRPEVMAWDKINRSEGERLFVRLRGYLPGSPQISSAWVSGAEGQTLLDSHSFPPEPADARSRRYFQAHMAGADEPFVGPTERGVVTGRDRFTISRAMRGADGAFEGVIAVAMFSDFFAELYRKVVRWADTTAAVTIHSPSGVGLLTHMRNNGPPAGLLEALEGQVRKARNGAEIVILPEGDRLITWHSSTHHPGLVVHTSQSLNAVLVEWRARAWVTGILFAALTLLLATIVYMLARSERTRRDAQVQQLLTREVHHRVKNNLAIIASLVRLGRKSVASGRDPDVQLASIATQIEALAELHAQMQVVPDGAPVDLISLLSSLSKSIGAAAGRAVLFTGSSDRAEIDGDRALHVLIVANELITNAIKHGRDPIEVHCEPVADAVAVLITNEPAEVAEPKSTSSFGLSMVNTLVGSIEGELQVVSSNPMVVRLTVPRGRRKPAFGEMRG